MMNGGNVDSKKIKRPRHSGRSADSNGERAMVEAKFYSESSISTVHRLA